MEELKESIPAKLTEFIENFKRNVDGGNKAAGQRARKVSLEMEKLFKQYRKASVEAAK